MSQQWEYNILQIESSDEAEIIDELDGLGREGWELVFVSASQRTFYFKRSVQLVGNEFEVDVSNMRDILSSEKSFG